MFITPAPNTIEHVDADCHCACCNQLHKPAKITALPSVLLRQSISVTNWKSRNMKQRPFPPCVVAAPCRIPHTAAGLRLAWQKSPSVSLVPLFPVRDTSFVNETGLATAQSRSNVISISVALKPAERVRAVKVEQANFKYPMLECS